MTPKSGKSKGRRLQNWVRDKIKDRYGIEADVAIMGERGKDVRHDRLPYSIECKNVERLNLWAAWQQAKANLFDDDTPVVIFTRNHADTMAVVPVEWFIDRLEIRNYDGTVQLGRGKGRKDPDTKGVHRKHEVSAGPDVSADSICPICQCLEAAGWTRPSTRKD